MKTGYVASNKEKLVKIHDQDEKGNVLIEYVNGVKAGTISVIAECLVTDFWVKNPEAPVYADEWHPRIRDTQKGNCAQPDGDE